MSDVDLSHQTEIQNVESSDAAKLCVAPVPQLPTQRYMFYPSLCLTSLPQSCGCPTFCSIRENPLTRNGLWCFPASVNRLPACEGIEGFDIGCCLTQKRRHGPRDGPFLTLHIHHVGQSNEWDTGLFPRGRWRGKRERRCRGVRSQPGVRFHPCMWVEVTRGPPTTFSHLGCSIFNGPLLSGSITFWLLNRRETIRGEARWNAGEIFCLGLKHRI